MQQTQQGQTDRSGRTAPIDVSLPSHLPAVDLSSTASTLPWEFGFPFTADSRYEQFFDRLFRALHRTSPRHVLMTRERGVGEQSVLLETARRALLGSPPFAARLRFVGADLRHLSVGEVQPTLLQLLSTAGTRPDVVLCIDGAANLFRLHEHRSTFVGFLAMVRCRVVVMLSPREFEDLAASDASIRELFTVLALHEPDVETAISLVGQYAEGLKIQFGIEISSQSIRQAVILTNNFIYDQRLPLKAVNVLRAICEDFNYDRTQCSSANQQVTEVDVAAKVASFVGLPVQTLTGVWEQFDYTKSLGEVVVGQDEALQEIATELSLIKAGFVDSGKPASVMLFIGQTGTGKTEMAKALAQLYSATKRLKTFTLGNFSEPHSVSGVIGVPAGYVGHEQGGRLVNELNADPYGVFLLDEADKAHPDVMQPFLNLFDEGWLLDQRGVKAHGDRAIFILTTNIGQRQIADLCKSGKTSHEIKATMKESLAKIRHTKSNRPVFSPEFLARIKRIIVFKSLDRAGMHGIARRVMAQLQERWSSQRQKTLQIADEIIDRLAERATVLDDRAQGKEGGRVVRKLFADWIESKVQVAIATDVVQYQNCHTVVLTWDSGVGDFETAGGQEIPGQIAVRFLE